MHTASCTFSRENRMPNSSDQANLPPNGTADLVLIVEDEPQMNRFLSTLLETSGYRLLECRTSREALALCASHNPDLVLLDLGLPDGDGLTVIARIREWTHTPIIVISAREQENDKINALDRGADDYVVKPFGARELLARMRVATRHARERSAGDHTATFENGRLRIDYQRRLAFDNGEEVQLTPTEYKLLVYLAQNSGKVLTHRQILREVWGPNRVEQEHYVRVYMSQLRRKFERDPANPQMLKTATGVGYRMQLLEDDE